MSSPVEQGLAGLAAAPSQRWPRQRRLRWLLRLPILAALAVVAGFAWFLIDIGRTPPAPADHTDGIAVLTGGAERVETGLRLLREEQAEHLLISGAHPDVTLADLLPRAALTEGGLAARVSVGHAATSTRGNAAEIAAWARDAGLRSVRVVTAAYHMPRALLELRRAVPDLVLVPHPVTPARLRDPGAASVARTWALLAGEYLKYWAAALGLSRNETGRVPA